MEDRKGQAVLKRIKQVNPQRAVIVFAANNSLSQMTRAYALQADGWLSKRCNRQELLATVRYAASGQSVWSKEQIRRLTGPLSAYRLDEATCVPLTPRQSEVLRHIVSGLTTQEIANTLHIRYDTAKEHVQNTIRKIGVSSRVQAAVWAVREGLA